MSKLTFVHAAPTVDRLPAEVRHWLDDDWKVASKDLKSVSKWRTLPSFTWLDLGHVDNPPAYSHVWKTLAGLQIKSADPTPHIFISGSAADLESHHKVLTDVFQTLRPAGVEVALAGGNPDVAAALAKFEAMRKESMASEAVKLFKQTDPRPKQVRPRALPNGDLRLKSGKLSAKSIAALFGVTLTELGEWIGRKKAALSKTPDSENIQPLLAPLAQIAFYREAIGGDAPFRKWLRTDHELLENKSPRYWIKAGRIREIANFVEDALTGQPA